MTRTSPSRCNSFACVGFVLCIAGLILSLSGCPEAGANGDGSGGADGDGIPDESSSTTSTITFSLPAPALSASGVGAAATGAGRHLFWVENYHRFASEIYGAPLADGTNSFDVNKDRTVVAAIVDVPESAAVSARSLGSAVSLVGTIEITAAGLDTIPVSESADDEIDLGSVTIDETESQVESTTGTAEIAGELGHTEETVTAFGRFDQVFTKFANLDIDHSGVPDPDENLRWNIITQTVFPMEGTVFDVETQTFLAGPGGIIPGQFEYMFIVQDIDEYSANDGVVTYPWLSTLTLPDNASGVTTLTQTGSYTTSWGPTESEFDDGGTAFYLRFPTTDPTLVSLAPVPGNYEVGVAETSQEGVTTEHFRFYLDNLEFMSPGDNYEGLVFPVPDYTQDGTGIVTSVGWRWKKIAGGAFADATPDEVRLQAMSFVLAFDNYPIGDNSLNFFQRRQEEDGVWYVRSGNSQWYPYKLGIGIYQNNDTEETRTDLGVSYFDTVTLDVSAYNYAFDPDVNSLVIVTEDSSGNFYGYEYSANAFVQ